jgi:hypothetical protein
MQYKTLGASGLLVSTLCDARYSFDALPDALDHLDRGPFGKVIVEIN